MGRLKMNNRRRRKSGVFSKLFDRFSSSKKKRMDKKKKALINGDEIGDDVEEEKKENDCDEFMDFVDIDCQNNETDDEIDEDDEDEDEFEISYFHNDHDSDSENGDNEVVETAAAADNSQMITLEALLSMHMTKGRILIEMKLLREALNLYTYIINECESLIKYHSMINGHHVELEREYEIIEEEKEEIMFLNHASSSGSSSSNSSSPRRHHRRRRNRRRSNLDEIGNGNGNGDSDILQNGPPPNTPYRRLTKNIGLENYYAARGDIFFKFKDLKNALKDFSNAIKYGKCKKEMGIYYNLRGVCYHEMKQYERALKDYDNAVKSMYGNHVAWNNRAALLVDMRQYDDAIENANNAIKLDPSYGNAYKHRGVAYHLKCEFEKAITDINRCIKLLPNYLLLAWLCWQFGRIYSSVCVLLMWMKEFHLIWLRLWLIIRWEMDMRLMNIWSISHIVNGFSYILPSLHISPFLQLFCFILYLFFSPILCVSYCLFFIHFCLDALFFLHNFI